ncbi:hypothetical protein B0J14DRAFT_258953 [Halenospora varia]|nr:hypothetical protein B0J14DRAFT_258953 [Halenospora varia]
MQFTCYSRLPKEIQLKIWRYALQPSELTPRIVYVKYNLQEDRFSYSCTIPPGLHLCRLSRDVFLEVYRPLVPQSTHPVYFNPDVDFLFCESPIDPLAPDHLLNDPNQEILPFIDPKTDVPAIRHLILHSNFWSHRFAANLPSPIKELRNFKKLENIFLVQSTIEETMQKTRNWIAENPNREPSPLVTYFSDLDALYAREVSKDAFRVPSLVPGYLTYPEQDNYFRMQLSQVFGWLEPEYDGDLSVLRRRVFDEYWTGRKLPLSWVIRAVRTEPILLPWYN